MERQNKRSLGTAYEKKAGAYLEAEGYEILEYNFRYSRGEIDIIARDGDYLVFCEVKYRKDLGAGHPAEAVDLRKQRKISRCALYYITIHQLEDLPCRFDVVSIEGKKIDLFKNAFDYVG